VNQAEKAIVPGRASESRLIKLVSSKDDAERMPSKVSRCRPPD